MLQTSTTPPSQVTTFLVIRFSAIGDIILTTPVLALIKKHYPEAQIHFLVKPKFATVLSNIPYIDKVIVFNTFRKILSELRQNQYNYIFDLQNSLRSYLLCKLLPFPSIAVDKQNIQKFRMTFFKRRLQVPHIVIRYCNVLQQINIQEAPEKLLFSSESTTEIQYQVSELKKHSLPVVAAVLGATHFTKRWPYEYWVTALNQIGWPVILLGGQAEQKAISHLISRLEIPYFNACGLLTLAQSAACIQETDIVISHDTGLMHIAAAFQKPIVSIWGNTVPEFGMYPWQTNWLSAEVELSCRPCHKIGYPKCPQQHFRCMLENYPEKIATLTKQLWNYHLQNPYTK